MCVLKHLRRPTGEVGFVLTAEGGREGATPPGSGSPRGTATLRAGSVPAPRASAGSAFLFIFIFFNPKA